MGEVEFSQNLTHTFFFSLTICSLICPYCYLSFLLWIQREQWKENQWATHMVPQHPLPAWSSNCKHIHMVFCFCFFPFCCTGCDNTVARTSNRGAEGQGKDYTSVPAQGIILSRVIKTRSIRCLYTVSSFTNEMTFPFLLFLIFISTRIIKMLLTETNLLPEQIQISCPNYTATSVHVLFCWTLSVYQIVWKQWLWVMRKYISSSSRSNMINNIVIFLLM